MANKPHGCVIDFQKGILRIKRDQEALSYEKRHKICRVTIANSVVIPANSMVTIACKVENGSTDECNCGVLEPARRFEERYNTGILKVAATIKNGQIPVRLLPDSQTDLPCKHDRRILSISGGRRNKNRKLLLCF